MNCCIRGFSILREMTMGVLDMDVEEIVMRHKKLQGSLQEMMRVMMIYYSTIQLISKLC